MITSSTSPIIMEIFTLFISDLMYLFLHYRRSDRYEFYCCYCSHGADIFSDAISHVINNHSHLEIRIGKKSGQATSENSRPLIHIRQWDVVPSTIHSEGHIIQADDETEKLEVCDPLKKSTRSVSF